MKQHHKKIIRGPGGLRCECCRCGSLRWSRIHLNRRTRRATRIELHLALTASAFDL